MPAAYRVVVIDGGYDRYDTERRILAPLGADVVVDPCEGDAARVAVAIADADAVLVRESPVRRDAIERAPRLRAIVRYGIGVDNVDLEAARARKVAVANVPDYGSEEVSDQALALLLAVVRRVAARDRAVRAGAWNVSRAEKMYRIAGRALGLVGYGRIARALERKLRGLGVTRVLVYDPFADAIAGVERVDPDTLCREADYISLHAPLTPDTKHLLSAARFALMKPTAIVVNTARGGLIDEAALVEALKQDRIFGAGIDVYEAEPPRAGHPLFALDNAVLSDHTGWYSEESVEELQTKAAEEVARVLRGEPPRHWLNR
ncbi:MAG TPA: C-terminal binding protein, partial [Burkholderiaceae bacterium]|nr:C-terminal binding protein [Burkholderiaceae bacterium]